MVKSDISEGKTLYVVQNQKYSASLKEKDGQSCHANCNQISLVELY